MEDRAQATHLPSPNDVKARFSWLYFVAKTALALLTAPYRRTFKMYTWIPLKDLRHVDSDRKMMISMMRDFQIDKYCELQSVQVAATFCAGATMATITWTKLRNPHWVADALWFCSLISSIWAVITTIQTKSILDDIPDKDQLNSSLPDMELRRTRRVILRYQKKPGIKHWLMLFVWQFPSMTMSYGWVFFMSGLTVYVCTPFIRHDEWSRDHKVAIVYLVVSGVCAFTYLFSSVFVYASEKDYLRSLASTRTNSALTSEEGSAIGIQAVDLQPRPDERQQGNVGAAQDPEKITRAKTWNYGDRLESDRRSTNGKRRVQLLI